jgi:hypothetical protein
MLLSLELLNSRSHPSQSWGSSTDSDLMQIVAADKKKLGLRTPLISFDRSRQLILLATGTRRWLSRAQGMASAH